MVLHSILRQKGCNEDLTFAPAPPAPWRMWPHLDSVAPQANHADFVYTPLRRPSAYQELAE